MGQKVHPTGMRLGISTDWTSRWYADGNDYAEFLSSDLEIRDYLKKKLFQASVSRIQIDRPARAAFITIHTARPGIVIGKKGEDIEALRHEVARRTGLSVNNVKINIEEIRKPEIDSQLVAESIAQQLDQPAAPFILAVLFGANMSYITPMAYKTNLLVMNAGGYKFMDFVKVGMPLTTIMWLSYSWLLPWIYKL